MYKKVEGIVLKKTRFSDNHAYIKILSGEGIITFIAYGIMSPKNKSFSTCQPYTYGEFVLKVTGDNATLSQASTYSHLIRQGIDFEGLALANYVISLAGDTAVSEEDAPKIMTLTAIALKLIDKKEAPSYVIKAVFELLLTAALGFEPDFNGCARCGKSARDGFFLVSEGSFVCSDCHFDENARAVKVDGDLISAISHLLTLPPKNAFGIRFSDDVKKSAFITLAERFSIEHLDVARDALNFYKDNIKNY